MRDQIQPETQHGARCTECATCEEFYCLEYEVPECFPHKHSPLIGEVMRRHGGA